MSTENQSVELSFETRMCLWITVILWSSALIGIRLGLRSYTPGAVALLRYLIASASLFILYFKLPKRTLPSWPDLLQIIFIGTVGIGFYNITLNRGEMVVPAGIAGFVIGLMPVFSMIFAILLLKERVPIKSWLGVLISMMGLYVITQGEHGGLKLDVGLFEVLLAAIAGSYYAVAQKKLFHRYHPLELVILTIWGGTLILLIYVPDLIHELPAAPWPATAAIVYLGIFPGAIAYSLWNHALHNAPAARASSYLYAMPIIATIMGACILQEYPSLLALTGGLITLFGAITINYFYSR